MKNAVVLAGLLLATIHNVSADEREIIIDFHKKTSTDETKTPNRTPMRFPIDVIYDTDTYEVKVVGDKSINAEVFLYDAVGNLEDYSATLNAYFYLYTSDTYTIRIEGDGWYAEGEIEM